MARLNFHQSGEAAKQKQVYAVLSVDTEHDIVSKYKTKVAGWSKGLPLLFDVFDASGVKGKVCWLIEYDLKDGILAANSNSGFYAKEFPELIVEIKNRGDGSFIWYAEEPDGVTLSPSSGVVATQESVMATIFVEGCSADEACFLGNIVVEAEASDQPVFDSLASVPVTLYAGDIYEVFIPAVMKSHGP